MGEYGRIRGSNPASEDGTDTDGWQSLGDHNGRFESTPPTGPDGKVVKLTRAQRRALALTVYAQQQAEHRHYGGRRTTWG